MPSSVFLMLALATTPGAPPAREPAHDFSTTQARSAELLSTAGTASVKAAVGGDARSRPAELLSTAGTASVRAVVREEDAGSRPTAADATVAGNGSVKAVAEDLARARIASAAVLAGDGSVKAAVREDARTGPTIVPVAAPESPSSGASGGMNVPSTSAAAEPGSPSSGAAPGTNVPSISDLGQAAAQAGAGALRAAAMALRSDSTAPAVADADASYTRGLEALKAKDTRTAITELSACVEAAPSRVDCRWELGWAYQVEGRWTDALTQWTEVKKLAPDHPDLETALAQARGQASLQEKLARGPQASNRPPPPPGAKVRIRAVGDVMLGTTVPEGHLPPDGAASVIAGVRPLLEDADLTFVNLEGPLCDGGKTTKCRSKGNCYAFRSPTSYGQVLKDAGVDVASTANNHSGDFGEVCRRETEATLDALGIPWSGPPGSIATVERNGLRIGVVAFHTSPSCNHLNNLATATALVGAAAAEHDLVVVSFHGGAEGSKALHVPQGREMFFGEDRGDLRTFARAVVDAGAHLVLGHGPHVARGMEFYKGRLIAYSMGNFATYGRFTLTGAQGLGMVLEVELDGEGRFNSGRILPTRQIEKGIAVPDPSGAVIKLVRGLTAEDFPDTGARISEDGTVKPAGQGPVSAVTGGAR
ncbi:CapA family protein [Myxococcus sp. RHSTA-1-4]|uniref:CapA family protein n=1 Tax=Myxococcus sp. RHSTA-1-4 TaxID=2874601 RepID=UPI001CBC0A12|nr:CapA family protein [Myxococcus sp. RHSTA-1-4]MBZ4417631.1 CapA family protein [Myxococcus sp. RHSTA-1-4]